MIDERTYEGLLLRIQILSSAEKKSDSRNTLAYYEKFLKILVLEQIEVVYV